MNALTGLAEGCMFEDFLGLLFPILKITSGFEPDLSSSGGRFAGTPKSGGKKEPRVFPSG
jgi:hypothetical protein